VRVGAPIETAGMTYDDRDQLSTSARATMERLAAR